MNTDTRTHVKHSQYGPGVIVAYREPRKDGEEQAFVLFDTDGPDEDNADWFPVGDLTVRKAS